MSRKIFSLLAAAAFGACLMVQPASAESRFALVIGNSSYRSVSQLANPVNDAKALTQVLSTAGFEVISATNLTQADMRKAIGDFSAKVAAQGKDTVALVYYAGHGLQVEGENFLVPVDARIEREGDVSTETLPLSEIMKALEDAPSLMRIVILDACRNNPFASIQKTSGRGLAMVDAPTGSIIAYSTAPGAEALDGAGTGLNSPYTTALLESMKEPGLQIEQLFKRVRLSVHKTTDGRQTPWESSSLTVNFAFFNAANTAVAAAQPEGGKPVVLASLDPQAATIASQTRFSELRSLPVERAYDVTIEEDSVEFYEEFVRLYSTHPLCDRIRRILFRRNQMVAWRNATVTNTADSYAAYATRYPNSDHASSAFRLQIQPRLRPIDPIVIRTPKFPSPGNGLGNSRPGGNPFPGQNNGVGQANNGNNGKVGIPLPGQANGSNQANNGTANSGKVGIPLPGQNNGSTQANNGTANNGKVGIPLPGQNNGSTQANNGRPGTIPVPTTGTATPPNAGTTTSPAGTVKTGGLQIPGQTGTPVNNGRPGGIQVPTQTTGAATLPSQTNAAGQITTVRPGTIPTTAQTTVPSQITTVRPGTIPTTGQANVPSQITTVKPATLPAVNQTNVPSQITTVRPNGIPAANTASNVQLPPGGLNRNQVVSGPSNAGRIVNAPPVVQPRVTQAPVVQQQRFTAPVTTQRFTAPSQPRLSSPSASFNRQAGGLGRRI